MSKAGRFGNYKPANLGPEPAEPSTDATATADGVVEAPSSPETVNAELKALRAMKVPYSSRITVAADQQLKAMARQGRSQTELLAEALNLLFKKHGLNQVA